jgi:hypothetical protein
LLYSLFPKSTASEVKSSLLQINRKLRTSIVPPLLDAWNTYQNLARNRLPQASFASITA